MEPDVQIVQTERTPGPPLPADWRERYLEGIRKTGNYYKPAWAIGISPKTAQRERANDPAFDDACREAREIAADDLEDRMVAGAEASGNPAGFIVRLKALRPAEYIEKHAITTLNATIDLNTLPVADATALLKQMLGATTPTTQKALTQGDTP